MIVGMRRAILALVAAGTFVVLQATPCLACSCKEATPAEIFERSDVVFTGTAIEDTPFAFSSGEVETRFTVEEVHKGAVAGLTVSVFAANQTPACGVIFRGGTRYTVYAGDDPGGLETNSCSGTHVGTFEQASDVPMHPYGALPAGSSGGADDLVVSGGEATPSNDAGLALGLAGLGLLAVAATVVDRRRRRA